MRFFLLALALVSSTGAFAAPQCRIPGLPDITGKSYHLARGMLIRSGFIPVQSAEWRAPRETIGPCLDDAREVGYIESNCPSQGFAFRAFAYPGFLVFSAGCEDLTNPEFSCEVKRIECLMPQAYRRTL